MKKGRTEGKQTNNTTDFQVKGTQVGLGSESQNHEHEKAGEETTRRRCTSTARIDFRTSTH